MISFSMNNSFNLLNQNEEHLEMLNLAQNYLNEIKYDIKYNEEINIGSQTLNVDNFKINKLIKKNSHYNCYEIVVEVKSIDRRKQDVQDTESREAEREYLSDGRRSSSCGKTLRAWTVRYCKNR